VTPFWTAVGTFETADAKNDLINYPPFRPIRATDGIFHFFPQKMVKQDLSVNDALERALRSLAKVNSRIKSGAAERDSIRPIGMIESQISTHLVDLPVNLTVRSCVSIAIYEIRARRWDVVGQEPSTPAHVLERCNHKK
jgi:hypothetical protein